MQMKLILGIITGLAVYGNRKGLTATPNQNLVSNIGFGRDSTHTAYSNSPLANMATFELDQIVHPRRLSETKKLIEMHLISFLIIDVYLGL